MLIAGFPLLMVSPGLWCSEAWAVHPIFVLAHKLREAMASSTNRIEQDHRGIKGRYQPMRGFKSGASAARFCRGYDELRNFLRPRSNRNQLVPASHRQLHILSRSLTVLSILQAA